jgi:ATP-dependent helicase/nuclease subunit A
MDEEFRRQIRNEKLAVQGVIDLILLDPNGKWMLYDYKTDRLTPEELNDPAMAEKKMNRLHGRQLSYYAYAASLLFGTPCERVCVYSTHAGKTFEIQLQPLTLSEETVDLC